MFRYLIIESMVDISQVKSTLMTFFNDLLHIDQVEQSNQRIIFYFQGEPELSFEDIIINLSSDTLTELRLFESYRFRTASDQQKNIQMMMKLLDKIAISKQAYLNEKLVLSRLIHDMDKTFNPCFLKSYANDQVMLNTVKVYLESNQNASHAAKQLFIHRNTLIQRIDKFIDVTGFDVREFVSGYLIYSLLSRN